MTKDWTPYRAELPLDPLEAFRLASFGIEHVPQYAPLMMDPDCYANRFYGLNRDQWVSLGSSDRVMIANLSALQRAYCHD